MIRNLSWFAGLIVAILIAAGGIYFWGYTIFVQPGSLRTDTIIYIPKGRSIEQISRLLAQKQVVIYPKVFELVARTLKANKVLQAGEYLIPTGSSPKNVLTILQSGKTVVRSFTAAEGLSTLEILGRLIQTEGLTGIITENAQEGELLPETYHFSYGDSRNGMVRRMKMAMKATFQQKWIERKVGLPIKSQKEALILASIVEKETGLPEERARIAGVFFNRLKHGIRLQSDPTVIYGLTNGSGKLGRPLNRNDLTIPNPYNTYQNKGLPPGPITNPGRASIEAVLRPAETKDLYFVANGEGGHAFAETLDEHNKNVAAWKKFRVGRGQKEN